MKKHTILLITIVLFLASFAGCSARPSSMISSTSPIPPGMIGTIETSASDCQYNLLGLIPITSSASTAQALKDAKRYANADVLTDVSVDQSTGYYVLWSNNCVRVSGYGIPKELLKNYNSSRKIIRR